MSTPQLQVCRWCFTINNFTPIELDTIVRKFWTSNAKGEWDPIKCDQVKFVIFQGERGENGTPHLQGYIHFSRSMKLGMVKKFLGTDRCHLEIAKGSLDDNITYCSKLESRLWPEREPWQWGDTSKLGQGTRSDLNEAAQMIMEGRTNFELACEYPSDFVRYHKGFEALRRAKIEHLKRTWEMEVYVILGDNGVGKTRYVYDKHGYQNIYRPMVVKDNTWWDGYQGEEVILFDDVRKLDIEKVLAITDRYPMIVPVKGSSMNFCSKIIYFTSNYEPRTWFQDALLNEEPNIKAFIRRVTKFYRISKIGQVQSPEIPWELVETLENPQGAGAKVLEGNTISSSTFRTPDPVGSSVDSHPKPSRESPKTPPPLLIIESESGKTEVILK